MKQYFQLFKEAWNEFAEDKAQRLGAALAYYTLFSIAPLLLIAIAIAGLVFGRDAAQGEIIVQIRDLIGAQGAVAVQGLLKSASQPEQNILATVVGIATLVFGATSV